MTKVWYIVKDEIIIVKDEIIIVKDKKESQLTERRSLKIKI